MRTLSTIAVLALVGLLMAGCAAPAEDGSGDTSTTANPNTATSTGSSTPAPSTGSSGKYDPPTKTTQVYGSGATFPKPLLESWAIQYSHDVPKVQVSYGGGGSGKGISDITKKDVFFGASDAPMSATEKDAANAGGNTVLQFPETLGVLAVVYNVNGVSTGLKLDGETLGKIYSGTIRTWDHQDIKDLNPGVSLPSSEIAIVYRSDSSGTTYVFTDYLVHTSSTFSSTVTNVASKKPDWTRSSVPASNQLSGNGNDGVGSQVKTTANSIGYVELAYVKSLNLKAASMKSHDGEFLAPTTAGATKAAASQEGKLPAPDGDWSKVSIVDAAGAGAYPISSFSYTLVYDSLAAYGSKATADQQAAFKAWMWWCLHDGQDMSETLGYAKLPSSVVTIGEGALASLK